MYIINAPRNVRVLYYAAEYGIRGAARLLNAEPKTKAAVRTPGGTAKKQCGYYRTLAEANKMRDRIPVMAASQAGRCDRGLANFDLVMVERAVGDELDAVARVRPLAMFASGAA